MLADMVDPGITVIVQDPYTLGRHAAELHFPQLNGSAGESQIVVVPTEIVARGSGEIAPAPART